MIYLDNCATSNNKPQCVKKAVAFALNNPVNVGRNSSSQSFRIGKKVYDVREKAAELINVGNPQNIVFTNNASMALNFAYKGIVKNNSHVITTLFEHNSVLRQIYNDPTVSCSFLPASEDYVTDISVLKTLINGKTSLIAVNCASNVTGVTVDYKKVYDTLKSFDIPVLFDFSQYAGVKEINLSGMKKVMAAFSGHKSLLGPQGTGVLYVSDDLELETVFEGGTGSLSEELEQPDYLPDRFEVGTINTPGILGMGAGIDFVLKRGIKNLCNHKTELCKRLYDGLMNIKGISVYHNGDFSDKIPIISFNFKDIYSEKIANILSSDFNISVRGGYHCAPYAHNFMGTKNIGAVRISPGYKTTKNDVDMLLYALSRISVSNI